MGDALCYYCKRISAYRAHDRRGCFPVCETCAGWRRFQCSRVEGHHKDCPHPNAEGHITSLDGDHVVDDFIKPPPPGFDPVAWQGRTTVAEAMKQYPMGPLVTKPCDDCGDPTKDTLP